MVIRRGSTPRITAKVIDDIELSSIKAVWLTVSQGIGEDKHIALDKVTSDLTINGRLVSVVLTQEETLSLVGGVISYIQIRLLDDEDIAYVSQQEFITIEDVLKGGVLV